MMQLQAYGGQSGSGRSKAWLPYAHILSMWVPNWWNCLCGKEGGVSLLQELCHGAIPRQSLLSLPCGCCLSYFSSALLPAATMVMDPNPLEARAPKLNACFYRWPRLRYFLVAIGERLRHWTPQYLGDQVREILHS